MHKCSENGGGFFDLTIFRPEQMFTFDAVERHYKICEECLNKHLILVRLDTQYRAKWKDSRKSWFSNYVGF